MKKITLILIFITTTTLLVAQWNGNSAINTSVCVSVKSQDNIHSVMDGKGGMIISWDDNRNSSTNSTDIYAQRILSNGINRWAANGISVCNNAASQKSSAITQSDNGSVIITWEDFRNNNYDIYAQKIDSNGLVIWPANGIAVCTKTTHQKNPKIISDNANGAIIVWEDSVNSYWDVYAQRISSTGTMLWAANGASVCTAAFTQINPKIDADNLGGAIITWQDKRNNTDYDIYAQRLNSSGQTLWTTNGAPICVMANTQNNPRVEPDGNNGAYFAWADKRSNIDYNVYAQRINAIGATQWTNNGVLVCGATNNQSAIDIKYIGTQGLVIAWKDDRVSPTAIYAQLISPTGSIQPITTNGIQLSGSDKSINPNVITDNAGGAIIAWQDSTTGGWNIKAQKLNAAGNIQWTSGGALVSDATNDQVNVSHVTDANGGAIFAWEDKRNGTDNNIFANRLNANGLFVGIQEFFVDENQSALVFPNPITQHSIIQLPTKIANQTCTISIYNSFGHLVSNNKVAANQSLILNKENYADGIYLYMIKTNAQQTIKGNFITAH